MCVCIYAHMYICMYEVSKLPFRYDVYPIVHSLAHAIYVRMYVCMYVYVYIYM
jgi:hypothetical protein